MTSKEQRLELALKDRVTHLANRAVEMRSTDKKLAKFLQKEVEALCQYHDDGELFLFLKYKAFINKK